MSLPPRVPEPDMARLKDVFKQRKQASGFTLDELVAISGLSRNTLQNVGSGRHRGDLRTWAKLARTWGLTLDELIAPIWERTDEDSEATEG